MLVCSRTILIIVKCDRKNDRNEKPTDALSFSPSTLLLRHVIKRPKKKQQIKIHFVGEAGREGKKVVKTKKAVYFMITTLTYANNFDIMKGMMNIKHIKIKISIWITTTSCGWKKRNESKYIARNKILPLIFYIITSFYVSKEVEGWKDFEILFFSPFFSSSLCKKQHKS